MHSSVTAGSVQVLGLFLVFFILIPPNGGDADFIASPAIHSAV